MIMEAFHNFEHKYQYSIVGHSGDFPEIPLVDYNNPPRTPKERSKVLQKMIAHTQYCSAGDTTIEAIQKATQNVVQADADEYYVFAVSDANLQKYGVTSEELRKVLVGSGVDKRVNCYAIFIASMGEQADQLKYSLPAAHAFLCLDTSTLPGIFKQIFLATMMKDVV